MTRKANKEVGGIPANWRNADLNKEMFSYQFKIKIVGAYTTKATVSQNYWSIYGTLFA